MLESSWKPCTSGPKNRAQKERKKQENDSVQIEDFAWHLEFALGMQTLCSAEVKGKCHLL